MKKEIGIWALFKVESIHHLSEKKIPKVCQASDLPKTIDKIQTLLRLGKSKGHALKIIFATRISRSMYVP